MFYDFGLVVVTTVWSARRIVLGLVMRSFLKMIARGERVV